MNPLRRAAANPPRRHFSRSVRRNHPRVRQYISHASPGREAGSQDLPACARWRCWWALQDSNPGPSAHEPEIWSRSLRNCWSSWPVVCRTATLCQGPSYGRSSLADQGRELRDSRDEPSSLDGW